jgi:predicted Holliday junction resolvase-like endonuclease
MDESAFLAVLLLIGSAVVGYLVGRAIERLASRRERQRREEEIRREAIRQSRSVIEGRVSEQLAPFLPGFSYSPSDARFLGSPIDLIVFEGLSDGRPREIVFVEVKKGGSSLTEREKAVRDLVEGKKVRWELYRIP